jgi:hypothetical protein
MRTSDLIIQILHIVTYVYVRTQQREQDRKSRKMLAVCAIHDMVSRYMCTGQEAVSANVSLIYLDIGG